MASIAIMAGGAILNAAAFIGGNYLARALGGGADTALKEKERHDKALEAYQAAYAKYSRDRTKLLDWIQTNAEIIEQAKQNFTNTDYAFKLYNQAHPDKQMIPPKEPKFSDFYQPSEQQKQGELMFVGAGALALGRYKEAEPLTSKDSTEVAKGFQTIYRRSALKWPQMLQVEGREFMGAVTKEMENHKTYIRHGRVNIHRDQAIVERFNQTLAERLFGYQYGVEMNLPSGQRLTAWVKRLPEVVAALNNEVTSLTGKKPAAAIKEKAVSSKPSSKYTRPVGKKEKKLPSLINVRYLYQPGELEGGVKRATDPIWSLKVYSIERSVTKPNQPVLYYLHNGPKRSFVREELLVIPQNTQLPPEKL
ncbi:hypothetical protein ACROYT_G043267 [Oculina patagonica]